MQVSPITEPDESCKGEVKPDNLSHEFSKWKAHAIVDTVASSTISDRTKIWHGFLVITIGDYQMRTVPVYSNADILNEALNAEIQPRSTLLSQVATEA